MIFFSKWMKKVFDQKFFINKKNVCLKLSETYAMQMFLPLPRGILISLVGTGPVELNLELDASVIREQTAVNIHTTLNITYRRCSPRADNR